MNEIGKIDGIKICSELLKTDDLVEIEYDDLDRDLRKEFRLFKKKISEQSSTLFKFTNPIKKEFILSREDYLKILQIKHSIVNRRSVDDKIYLKYLLQSVIKKDLEQICRDLEIKGFSNKNKDDLIDFIDNNLSEEEARDYIIENEQSIISLEIAKALQLMNSKNGRETIKDIKIVNSDKHEIEITFEGFDWETKSFIAINKDNLSDPERDCDCKVGTNGGFCEHFWVGFIESLKRSYFNYLEWNLTFLPNNFKEI